MWCPFIKWHFCYPSCSSAGGEGVIVQVSKLEYVWWVFVPILVTIKLTSSAYQVTSLPEVPFDLGEMYSGNMPVKAGDNSRELFFIFQPTVGAPVDEITIWLNGGPGCSSIEGKLVFDRFDVCANNQRLLSGEWKVGRSAESNVDSKYLLFNYRFVWKEGTPSPAINQNSWVNLTNMLW
jgi:carboxypeptidase D